MERFGVHPEEVSDDQEVSIEEEKLQGNFNLVRLCNPILVASSRPWLEMPTYDGSLNVEELSWITLDKYFDYEEVDKAMKVNFVVTKMINNSEC